MKKSDSELVALHAEMRKVALDQLGPALLTALEQKLANEGNHESSTDARRNDR